MRKIFIVCLFVITNFTLFGQSKVDLELINIDIKFPQKSAEIKATMSKIKNNEEKEAFKFLIANSPLSDLADYSSDFIYSNAKLALLSQKEFSWGKLIPKDVFRHFVLPMRVNNENLDSFRIVMYEELKERVKNLSMYNAALEVNHWCHEKVTYQASDGRTSAPLSTIRYSFGRCGEESTLLVSALRTAGIPARQVYTPRWAHTDDNHAWVEVWVEGKWYYLGACEPLPELNMGWFSSPSTRTMYVHSRVFGKYSGNEPVIVNSDKYAEINLISNYTKTKTINISVIDKNKKPVSNANVEVQLYNYSEFYPLVKLKTDKKGRANFTTGIGDLIIWAYKDSQFAFIKADKNESNFELMISANPILKEMEFQLSPPDEGEIVVPRSDNIELNKERLVYEDSLRAEYMKSFLDSSKSIEILKSSGINNLEYSKYLVNSFGNWNEILQFIVDAENKYTNNYAIIQLLDVISKKDLRDTKSNILINHLSAALEHKNTVDNEIWKNYILNPRVHLENMKKWRGISNKFVNQFISKNQINEFNSKNNKQKVELIISIINTNIKLDNIGNLHSRAPITPEGVLFLKICDKISRDIFFVALCRDLGIPARIDSKTGITQYLNVNGKNTKNSKWVDVIFDSQNTQLKYGYVTFKNASKFEPKYYSNFTIRRLENGVFRTIEYDDIIPLSQFSNKIEVPTGKYMLVTGNREQNGTAQVRISYFDVEESMETIVNVKVIDVEIDQKPWAKINLNELNIVSLNNMKTETLSSVLNEEYFILAFIDPDKEPTKHFITELPSLQSNDVSKKVPVLLAVEGGQEVLNQINNNLYKSIPNSSFAIDYQNNILKKVGNLRNENLANSLPIVILGNMNGELFYFNKGYKIGIINEIIQLLNNKKN